MNHGLIIDSIDKRDYIFVGAEGKIKSWLEYLPTRETQHGVYGDTKSCVTFSIMNQIETKLNSMGHNQWLEDNGYYDENGKVNFSDRFTAVMSGTTSYGNSGREVYKAVKEFGLIPESMHPYPRKQRTPVFTFGDYHNKSLITDEMIAKGKEFSERFDIRYFYVDRGNMELINEALNDSPLLCYVRTSCTEKVGCSGTPNHATMYFTDELKNGWLQVFDSYESKDKDFIRLMDKEYQFEYNLCSITIKENNMNFVKEKSKSAVYIKTPDDTYVPIIDQNVVKKVFGGWDKIHITEVDKIDSEKITSDRLGLISFEK